MSRLFKNVWLKFNRKDVERLGKLCPQCNHLETFHMRNPSGEGRERKAVYGTCSECRKMKQECKFYMSR